MSETPIKLEWMRPLLPTERGTGIGGTDISAIVGLNPWKSPFDVWLEKKGQAPTSEATELMEWGLRAEPIIASAYADRTGNPIVKVGVALRHPELVWFVGSPDYVLSARPAGIDCKNIRFKSASWGEAGTDQIPEHYLLQAQWYMSLTGAKEWELPVLFGGSQFEVFHVQHNDKLEASLLEAADEFWQKFIVGNRQPEISDTPLATAWIRSKFGRNTKPLRKATPSESQLALDLAKASTASAEAEKEKKDLEARLKVAIGEHDGIEGAFGKITWKANKDSEKTDWEAVARALNASPELIKKHTTTTPGARVLRPSIKEGLIV